MKLKELITKLQGKPNQEEEVEFLVYEAKSGYLVCIDMTGDTTLPIMKILAKRTKKRITPTLPIEVLRKALSDDPRQKEEAQAVLRMHELQEERPQKSSDIFFFEVARDICAPIQNL